MAAASTAGAAGAAAATDRDDDDLSARMREAGFGPALGQAASARARLDSEGNAAPGRAEEQDGEAPPGTRPQPAGAGQGRRAAAAGQNRADIERLTERVNFQERRTMTLGRQQQKFMLSMSIGQEHDQKGRDERKSIAEDTLKKLKMEPGDLVDLQVPWSSKAPITVTVLRQGAMDTLLREVKTQRPNGVYLNRLEGPEHETAKKIIRKACNGKGKGRGKGTKIVHRYWGTASPPIGLIATGATIVASISIKEGDLVMCSQKDNELAKSLWYDIEHGVNTEKEAGRMAWRPRWSEGDPKASMPAWALQAIAAAAAR